MHQVPPSFTCLSCWRQTELKRDDNTGRYFQVNTGELYDVVNYKTKEKPGVSVQALRTLWDQKPDHRGNPGNNLRIRQQSEALTAQPPALPPKSKSRKLTGAVSVDTMSLSQVRHNWSTVLHSEAPHQRTPLRWPHTKLITNIQIMTFN